MEPGGVLRWIQTEEIAKSLYGMNWTTKVRDINEVYFANYTFGADIDSAVYPAGSLFKYGTSSNVYYMQNGLKRWIENSSAFDANRFQSKFIQTAPESFSVGDGMNIIGQESMSYIF